MQKVFAITAMLALGLSPALAATKAADTQPSVQSQLAQLQQQVASLQKQVEQLQSSAHSQPVCISFWCGTVVTGRRAPV